MSSERYMVCEGFELTGKYWQMKLLARLTNEEVLSLDEDDDEIEISQSVKLFSQVCRAIDHSIDRKREVCPNETTREKESE